MSFKKFKIIGLAKETESPENPGSLEKRVALIPSDLKRLVEFGIQMFVEQGAGEGIGYSDQDYVAAGAVLQSHEDIYKNKDMIIKFNGPALEVIPKITRGTTLLCFAHFDSIPKRAEELELYKINVIAMEEILESPKKMTDELILSKKAMNHVLMSNMNLLYKLNVSILGYSERLLGGIRRAGNRNTNTLTLYTSIVHERELEHFNSNSIYFYDSKSCQINDELLDFLKSKKAVLFDLAEFEDNFGEDTIRDYRSNHPPFEFGRRRIEALHEVGQAAARYGCKLLMEESKKVQKMEEAKVTVIGYGNVGLGAIHELYSQGVRKINILTPHNTTPERIKKYLSESDMIINAALLPPHIRGKVFLVTENHVKKVLQKGAVVIDIIGGSINNRSAVESIVEHTDMDNPYFIKEGIYFSSLWGWPKMGMMNETAVRYSSQIVSVLIEEEMLIDGLGTLAPGVKKALVCGPFEG